jgi:hypothetical protein
MEKVINKIINEHKYKFNFPKNYVQVLDTLSKKLLGEKCNIANIVLTNIILAGVLAREIKSRVKWNNRDIAAKLVGVIKKPLK